MPASERESGDPGGLAEQRSGMAQGCREAFRTSTRACPYELRRQHGYRRIICEAPLWQARILRRRTYDSRSSHRRAARRSSATSHDLSCTNRPRAPSNIPFQSMRQLEKPIRRRVRAIRQLLQRTRAVPAPSAVCPSPFSTLQTHACPVRNYLKATYLDMTGSTVSSAAR